MKIKLLLPTIVLACIGIVINNSNVSGQNITGTDFWFSMPTQTGGPFTDETHRLYIASDYTGTATINYVRRRPPYKATADANSTFSVSFSAGVTQVVILSSATNVNQTYVDKDAQTETIQPNGFHITSTQPIIVYALNEVSASSETSPIYPSVLYGTDYIVSAYRENYLSVFETTDAGKEASASSNNFMSRATIIGTQNNTNISITLPSGTASKTRAAGSTWSITLNEGQTYSLHAMAQNGSNWVGNKKANMGGLTGTHIVADKPISVIGGASCSQVGAQQYYTNTGVVAQFCGACDIMFSHQIPTSFWGTEFVTSQAILRGFNVQQTNTNAPIEQSSMADYVEFFAQQNGTQITVDGIGTEPGTVSTATTVINLNANQRYRYEVPGNFDNNLKGEANLHIQSNKPISVIQYVKGTGCDNSQYADPSNIYILPVTTWIDKYITTTPLGAFPTNDIVFIIKGTANTGTVTLDGVPEPNTGWTQIGNSGYYFKRHSGVAAGSHKSNAAVPFGIVVSGTGSATSYAYSGGGPQLITSPLPVHLLSFIAKANDNKVSLNWTSASEENCKEYIIERSSNGISFTAIGATPAVGHSSERQNYYFTDNNPEKGISYYRLQIVDFSGKREFSPVSSVNLNVSDFFSLKKLSPNPTNNNLSVSLQSVSDAKLNYSIQDITGREVLSGKNIITTKGATDFDIDVNDLSNGLYYLFIIDRKAEQVVQAKFLKN